MKAQAAVFQREDFVRGRIKPGSKITRRAEAHLLSISRMPARDALMGLERHGFIVTKPGGRYGIEVWNFTPTTPRIVFKNG